MTETAPTTLVSTAWLAERLGQPGLRILDATWYMHGTGKDQQGEFVQRHIPGAAFFDVDGVAAPGTAPLPHMVPSAAQFADQMADLGISDGDTVIVYDNHGLQTAGRAWWLFRLFGHDKVAILDGGLPKWLGENRPVESGKPTPAKGNFTAALRPELIRGIDDVIANVNAPAFQVVDARSRARFEATGPESWANGRAGHIPGSLNLPFTDLLDPDTKTVLPADTIAAKLTGEGISLDGPVVVSCGSGVTACVIALGYAILGRTDVAIYDGSWAEWGLRRDLPIATGPAA